MFNKKEYYKETYKQINIKLHNERDKDIIMWLENVDNLKEYIVKLINEDLEVRFNGNDKNVD